MLQYKCLKPCTRTNLSCSQNHKCLKECHEECSLCVIKVNKKLECGHFKKDVECYKNINDIKCSPHLPCNRKLKCGHKCQKRCSEECVCTIPVSHKICPSSAKRLRNLLIVVMYDLSRLIKCFQNADMKLHLSAN